MSYTSKDPFGTKFCASQRGEATNHRQLKSKFALALSHLQFVVERSIRSLFVRVDRFRIGPVKKLPLEIMPARRAALSGACRGWVRWPRWRGLLGLGQRRTFVQFLFICFPELVVHERHRPSVFVAPGAFLCMRLGDVG